MDNNKKLFFLSAMLINFLTKKCTEIFMDNEEAILSEQLNKSLIDILDHHTTNYLEKVDEISIRDIYNHKSVIEIEIAAYNVIGDLLDEFVTAVLHPTRDKSKKLIQLVPKQFNTQQYNLYANI